MCEAVGTGERERERERRQALSCGVVEHNCYIASACTHFVLPLARSLSPLQANHLFALEREFPPTFVVVVEVVVVDCRKTTASSMTWCNACLTSGINAQEHERREKERENMHKLVSISRYMCDRVLSSCGSGVCREELSHHHIANRVRGERQAPPHCGWKQPMVGYKRTTLTTL